MSEETPVVPPLVARQEESATPALLYPFTCRREVKQ